MPAILKVSKTHRVTVTESEATLHYNLKSLSFYATGSTTANVHVVSFPFRCGFRHRDENG